MRNVVSALTVLAMVATAVDALRCYSSTPQAGGHLHQLESVHRDLDLYPEALSQAHEHHLALKSDLRLSGTKS